MSQDTGLFSAISRISDTRTYYCGSRPDLQASWRFVHLIDMFSQWLERCNAEACYVHNMHTNGLYRLPQELMQTIIEYLADCDRLSLVTTCRRPRMQGATVAPSTQSLFRERLYRDYIARTTVLETKLELGSLEKLFCNACRKHHPRSCFSTPEIDIPACACA